MHLRVRHENTDRINYGLVAAALAMNKSALAMRNAQSRFGPTR